MKIAVVGSGKLGQRHLNAWKNINGAEIVGVIARNKERLNQVAKEYGTKAYESIQELVKNTAVDIIDICTPSNTHAELVKVAAKLKKHIICEKPLALTKEEANELIECCNTYQVQLLVGHTLRFFPAYVDARQQIQNGAIGNPGVIRMARGVPHPPEDSWYVDEEKSGGLFFDLGIHELDWLLWTFGDVKRVMAKRTKHRTDDGSLEYGFITLKMTNGAIAHIETSWAETKFRSSFELAGDQGMITFDHDGSTPLSVQLRTSEQLQLPRSLMTKDPYHRQLEHFLHVIAGKEEPIVTAVEAVKAIEVAQAAMESAKTGQPVILSGGRKIR